MSDNPAIAKLPEPTPNEGISAHDSLIYKCFGSKYSELIPDIQLRKDMGLEKYNTTLQPHNGRAVYVEEFQEFLDAVAYLEKTILELGGDDELLLIQTTILDAALIIKSRLEQQNGQTI